MTLNDYQIEANKFAIYNDPYYPFASVVIEAAELADVVTKPLLRGDPVPVEKQRAEVMSEAGDVLWNLAACLDQYNITLEEAAIRNLQKLSSRKQRGKLMGSGGDR